jgi:hypothetical protein
MPRFAVVLLLLDLVTPAFAKPYPVPCNDLWSTVSDTLGDARNYKIVATDDDEMKASFIVVGALYPGVNAVFLKSRDNGCDLNVKMGFTGSDDEGALRSRVHHALAKRKAAKPSQPSPTTGASE